MGTKQIDNPNGAFGVTSLNQTLPQPGVGEFKAAGAIAYGAPVAFTTTGSIVQIATDAGGVVGVALQALTTGETGYVVCLGVVENVPAGGATTSGVPVIRSATTSGYVTSSATPVAGTKVGIAINSSADGTVDVWVTPA